ncbi:MAG: hypothetical protein EBT27_02710 [Betaproteobacteria bacterium]|nr:hypothetical protein [Betaproteobacteria bacterium]
MDLAELRKRSGGSLVQRRELQISLGEGEGDELTFSFSSEQPVERWFGTEILSHQAGAADLARLNDGAPFLWNHDRDAVIGVVQQALFGDDQRGYAKVKWSRNAMAQEKRQDVEDGILRNVSFAYEINDAEEGDDGTLVVTRWTPLEVSLVSIPADNSVGLGRAMDDAIPSLPDVVQSPAAEEMEAPEAPAPQVDMEVIRSEAVKAERDRIASITALGDRHDMADLARQLIDGVRRSWINSEPVAPCSNPSPTWI